MAPVYHSQGEGRKGISAVIAGKAGTYVSLAGAFVMVPRCAVRCRERPRILSEYLIEPTIINGAMRLCRTVAPKVRHYIMVYYAASTVLPD